MLAKAAKDEPTSEVISSEKRERKNTEKHSHSSFAVACARSRTGLPRGAVMHEHRIECHLKKENQIVVIRTGVLCEQATGKDQRTPHYQQIRPCLLVVSHPDPPSNANYFLLAWCCWSCFSLFLVVICLGTSTPGCFSAYFHARFSRRCLSFAALDA